MRPLPPFEPDRPRVAADAQDHVLGFLKNVPDSLLAVDIHLVGRTRVQPRLGGLDDRLEVWARCRRVYGLRASGRRPARVVVRLRAGSAAAGERERVDRVNGNSWAR